MTLMRWEPCKEADEFFRNFGKVLPARWLQPERVAGESATWTPAADITETDNEYLVKAEVLGEKPGNTIAGVGGLVVMAIVGVIKNAMAGSSKQ